MVTFTSREMAIAHTSHFGLTFPILLDPTKATYAAFGLERATFGRVWGLRAAWKYLQLSLAGKRRMRMPTGESGPVEDTRQLGGDFVLRDGKLYWGYWSEGSEDRPDPAAVLAQCLR